MTAVASVHNPTVTGMKMGRLVLPIFFWQQ